MLSKGSRAALVALAAAALLAPMAMPATAAEPVSAPLATGLAGPLGLAVAPNGTVYVAQSFGDPESGTPSTLTAVAKDGSRTDLVSVTDGEVAGIDVGRRNAISYVTTGGTEAGPYAGLSRLLPSGRSISMADLAAWEQNQNPDGDVLYGFQGLSESCAALVPEFAGGGQPYSGIIEAHPYKVASLRDGSRIVADAAGNDLIRVTTGRKVSTLAVLPPQPLVVTAEVVAAMNADIERFNEGLPPEEQSPPVPLCVTGSTYLFEAVPTDVEAGPGDWVYVTTLPGGPESPALGARGSVYRVHTLTGAIELVATGFLGAIDLALAPNGTIYVAELAGGRISKVVDGGAQTVVEVPFPAAVEWSRGKLYATIDAFGFATEDGGSLVTITP